MVLSTNWSGGVKVTTLVALISTRMGEVMVPHAPLSAIRCSHVCLGRRLFLSCSLLLGEAAWYLSMSRRVFSATKMFEGNRQADCHEALLPTCSARELLGAPAGF